MARKQTSNYAKKERDKAEDRIIELKREALESSGVVLERFDDVSECFDE